MDAIFKPHGFTLIDPTLPGFARSVFASTRDGRLFIQEVGRDETVRFVNVEFEDAEISKFDDAAIGKLTQIRRMGRAVHDWYSTPLYVFSWGDGKITAGCKDEVAIGLLERLHDLIQWPHIYASAADFIYSSKATLGGAIHTYRRNDGDLLFFADQKVASLQMRTNKILTTVLPSRVVPLNHDAEARRLYQRFKERLDANVMTLAALYLETGRSEQVIKLIELKSEGSDPTPPPWARVIDEVVGRLRFADNEIAKRKYRVATSVYASVRAKYISQIDDEIVRKLAEFSISKRCDLLRTSRDVLRLREWQLLDCLLQELGCLAGSPNEWIGYAGRSLLLLASLFLSEKETGRARDVLAIVAELATLAAERKLSIDYDLALEFLLSQASLEVCAGDPDRAEECYLQAISRLRRDDENANTMVSLASVLATLSNLYLGQERLIAAEATAIEAVAMGRILTLGGIPKSRESLFTAQGVLERLYVGASRDLELSLLRKTLDASTRS
ncbi:MULTISPECIES: hypothetical protein [unclassified Caballeronia]|uniref:hypothetical protein n=1 Tax=unclassified Caballeronia TaxID=2646786 RepID=UPI00158BB500|nr:MULTISPECIES: hypothetical protein [unclassified Caballeronia]QSN63491.1 hypothetical protein JYK05_14795 [Caballeronia sp. M1242]